MTTFSDKEMTLMQAVIKGLNSDVSSQVNFTAIAAHAGYKDAKNAKVMWRRLMVKINGSAANDDNDGEEGASAPKNTGKGKGVETGAAEDDDEGEEDATTNKSEKRKTASATPGNDGEGSVAVPSKTKKRKTGELSGSAASDRKKAKIAVKKAMEEDNGEDEAKFKKEEVDDFA